MLKIRNKEISWLSFNARVLEEAADPTVPLIERIKFLGIFSSNLDEFFRVRVATLKRLEKIGKKATKLIGEDPKAILAKIYDIVLAQQSSFENVYRSLMQDLEKENIFLVNEETLSPHQQKYVQNYFRSEVRQALIPIMITENRPFPDIRDHALYLAVSMEQKKEPLKPIYALIEIPTGELPRFLVLPPEEDRHYIILLDDVIRFSLSEIFSMIRFDKIHAYTIKLTRDAELDIDDDFSESIIRKISNSLKKRKIGAPVRFLYDESIPSHLLKYFMKQFKKQNFDNIVMPGGRYHNFKDFINFPNFGSPELRYRPERPIPHRYINGKLSLFKILKQRDVILHYPYQSFDYVIDFLREAAIDPKVTAIRITLYRVARNSKVINALINAVRNGKEVTVIMELQARFDEEANISWSDRLQEEGVRVVHGVLGLKVHAKLILVTRSEKNQSVYYACIGTGNFHENTARLYSDHALFTHDARLTREAAKVFDLIENNYKRPRFKHLIVSPFSMRQRWLKLIDDEIKAIERGEPAHIIVKLNNLTDPGIIKKLYKASQAGVDIRLMVRGMFSLVPGVKGMSEKIRAIGTVDRFLEHSRLFVFGNSGNEKYYISSADWMPRNLDSRIEVACPIYNPEIRKELKDFLEIHWQDNVKARILNKRLDNRMRNRTGRGELRAQFELFNYFRAHHRQNGQGDGNG